MTHETHMYHGRDPSRGAGKPLERVLLYKIFRGLLGSHCTWNRAQFCSYENRMTGEERICTNVGHIKCSDG